MPTHAERLNAYYRAWTQHHADALAGFFHERAVFEDLAFNATFEGHEGVRTFAQITFAGAPDFEITPTEIVVDGDRAGASWTMRGTHTGDMPGFPATGRRFEIEAASVIRLEDGLIISMRDFWNPAGLR